MLIPSILLIDDDEVDAEMVKRVFHQYKIENPLFHAEDGLSALALLRGKPGVAPLPKPHIILLDINMPRMNGLEFLSELQQDPTLATSLVVVLTASTNPQDKLAACQKQIAGYILKQNVGQHFANAFRFRDNDRRMISCPDLLVEALAGDR